MHTHRRTRAHACTHARTHTKLRGHVIEVILRSVGESFFKQPLQGAAIQWRHGLPLNQLQAIESSRCSCLKNKFN